MHSHAIPTSIGVSTGSTLIPCFYEFHRDQSFTVPEDTENVCDNKLFYPVLEILKAKISHILTTFYSD